MDDSGLINIKYLLCPSSTSSSIYLEHSGEATCFELCDEKCVDMLNFSWKA